MSTPADTARRLLARFGRANLTLRRPSADMLVPSDRPWAPQDVAMAGLPDPLLAGNLTGVILDAVTYAAHDRSMALADRTTSVALLSADAPEPHPGDTLETPTYRGSVLKVETLAPDGTVVLYTLHLAD